MITSATLLDTTRGLQLVLNPRPGVLALHAIEITPTVREVTEDWAQADGALDTSQWMSAAAVTLGITVMPSQPGVLDQLTQFLAPWARPYLIVTDTDWLAARQIQLRADPWQHPLEIRGGGSIKIREMQLAFKAPRGVWEDSNIQIFDLGAVLTDTNGMVFADTTGVVVTDTAGYIFPASSTSGSSIVNVNGNTRPAWRARMYGPCSGPQLSNDTTGQSLSFNPTLVLNPGDFLEVNSGPGTLARTANLNGQSDSSRLSFMDFAASEWFPIDPGANNIRYHPVSGGSVGAICELTIYPVWLP
jgi:hypothetical protein